MVDSFDDVQYIPGGATLNTVKVAQVSVLVSEHKV